MFIKEINEIHCVYEIETSSYEIILTNYEIKFSLYICVSIFHIEDISHCISNISLEQGENFIAKNLCFLLAEREGFEPSVPFGYPALMYP